jgi:WD40 repeat protein
MGGALTQGTVVGRWQVVSTLGVGGMGAVYRVRDQAGNEAALKLLIPDASDKATERFRREIGTASAVQHPNVIRFLEWGKHGDVPFLVLELARGGSLKELVRGRGPLAWREAVRVGIDIAQGLAAIHALKLIHRDLKPENVLLDDGRARITDFGIARHEATGLSVGGLTKTGELVGTLEYIAPEQCESARLVDARADLYALGGLLFFLLTGRPPFEGKGITLVTQHLQSKPRAPRSLGVKMPVALESLVLALLEKDPQARPQSADEVASRLDEIAATSGDDSPRSLAGRVLRALGAVLVIAAACAVSYAFRQRETTPVPVTPPPPRPLPPPPPPAPPPLAPLPQPPECDAFRSSANGLMKLEWAAGRYRDRHRRKSGGDLRMHIVAASSDGARLLSVAAGEGSRPETSVAVWDAKKRTLDLVYDAEKEGGIVYDAAFVAGGRVALAFQEGFVSICDPAQKRLVALLGQHEGSAISIAASPDGTRVATTSFDSTIKVWDASPDKLEAVGEKCLATIRLPRNSGRALFLPDGRRVIAACDDGKLRVYDWRSGTLLQERTATEQACNMPCVALSPDGKLAATTHFDNIVRIWDLERPDLAPRVVAAPNMGTALHALAFGRGGKVLALITERPPAGLFLYDLDGTPQGFLASLAGQLHAVAALPDGRLVAADGWGALPVFDLERGAEVEDSHFLNVAAVGYGKGGTVVSAAWDGTIRTWGPKGEPLSCANGPEKKDRVPGKLLAAAFVAGTTKAFASFDGPRLVFFDGGSGAVELKCASPMTALGCSPDGSQLVAASKDGVELRDASTGEPLAKPIRFWVSARPKEPHGVPPRAVAFSPSGKTFVADGDHGALYVYGVGVDEPLYYDGAHESAAGRVRAPGMLLDDDRVVWGTQDGGLASVDVRQKRKPPLTVATGTKSQIVAVASLRGGTRALLGYEDGRVSLWDLVSGRELDSLSVAAGQSPDEREHACCFAVAPDERGFVVGTKRGLVLRFELGK